MGFFENMIKKIKSWVDGKKNLPASFPQKDHVIFSSQQGEDTNGVLSGIKIHNSGFQEAQKYVIVEADFCPKISKTENNVFEITKQCAHVTFEVPISGQENPINTVTQQHVALLRKCYGNFNFENDATIHLGRITPENTIVASSQKVINYINNNLRNEKWGNFKYVTPTPNTEKNRDIKNKDDKPKFEINIHVDSNQHGTPFGIFTNSAGYNVSYTVKDSNEVNIDGNTYYCYAIYKSDPSTSSTAKYDTMNKPNSYYFFPKDIVGLVSGINNNSRNRDNAIQTFQSMFAKPTGGIEFCNPNGAIHEANKSFLDRVNNEYNSKYGVNFFPEAKSEIVQSFYRS